jgi:hypothetical protein
MPYGLMCQPVFVMQHVLRAAMISQTRRNHRAGQMFKSLKVPVHEEFLFSRVYLRVIVDLSGRVGAGGLLFNCYVSAKQRIRLFLEQ